MAGIGRLLALNNTSHVVGRTSITAMRRHPGATTVGLSDAELKRMESGRCSGKTSTPADRDSTTKATNAGVRLQRLSRPSGLAGGQMARPQRFERRPRQPFTKDELLTNITIYWPPWTFGLLAAATAKAACRVPPGDSTSANRPGRRHAPRRSSRRARCSRARPRCHPGSGSRRATTSRAGPRCRAGATSRRWRNRCVRRRRPCVLPRAAVTERGERPVF